MPGRFVFPNGLCTVLTYWRHRVWKLWVFYFIVSTKLSSCLDALTCTQYLFSSLKPSSSSVILTQSTQPLHLNMLKVTTRLFLNSPSSVPTRVSTSTCKISRDSRSVSARFLIWGSVAWSVAAALAATSTSGDIWKGPIVHLSSPVVSSPTNCVRSADPSSAKLSFVTPVAAFVLFKVFPESLVAAVLRP